MPKDDDPKACAAAETVGAARSAPKVKVHPLGPTHGPPWEGPQKMATHQAGAQAGIIEHAHELEINSL